MADKAKPTKQQEADQLFDKLAPLLKSNSHDKAIRVIESILQLTPKDEDAIRCKVAALTHLSKFEDALGVITKFPNIPLDFEKAYCLYRVGRFEEALQSIQQSPGDRAAAALQLEAQLHYRLGNNKQCIQAYEKLLQSQKDVPTELKTNVLAAYVAAQQPDQIPAVMAAIKAAPKDSFEVAFNRACGLVEAGNLTAAQNELLLAIKSGREALFDEDLGEEEVEEELAPLTVQLAYVEGRLGKLSEAVQRYEALLQAGTADQATMAVATNNLIADMALMGEHEGASAKRFFATSAKKLEALMDKSAPASVLPELRTRLSSAQQLSLQLNRGLLSLRAGRADVARAVALALTQSHPDSQDAALLRAAVLAKEGKAAEAEQLLASFSSSQPSQALRATLMRAQLAAEGADVARALQLLDAVGDASLLSQPAMLATRLALYEQLGDPAGGAALLEGVLSALPPRGAGWADAGTATWCLQRLVALQLRVGRAADAMASYQRLRAADPHGTAGAEVLAGLLRAVASAGDVAGAAVLSAELRGAAAPSAVEAELGEAQVDSLEASSRGAGPASGAARKGAGAGDITGRKREGDGATETIPKAKKAKKKKKKVRYPAGYDPALPGGGLPPPDPERWVPKWQRADAAKKKKKKSSAARRNEPVKGSQGAGKVDENLDRTKAPLEDSKVDAGPSRPTLPARNKGGRNRR